jgi:hypothetical protein
MRSGDTFLMEPWSGGKRHLWVVVTEPDSESFECVIVSIATLRGNCDQTVVLQPGDHPFIRHPSVVFFADARIVDARRLDQAIAAGKCERHQPCSSELLAEVCKGIITSPHTPQKVIAFCKRAWRK